ncbi:hypothetical protein OUZ56_010475 [Daphnia magna]|uniref:Uncharacterized protein n=1 Tax=Daphnia magna TaxID=35525 RepID=A0ABR0AIN0_9CRUS|nr:hypothetical protein OUZ56_010475 [Daphnia magna]
MHVDDCAEETQLSIVTDVLTSNTEECNVIHQGNSRHSDHQPNNKSTFERSVVADYPEMISSLPTSIDDLGIFIPADNWTELNQGLANRPSHNTHLVEAMFVGEVHSIRKSVTVDFLHSTVTTYMLDKLCDPVDSGIKNPQKFSNYAEANYILREFAARGRCVGISVAKFQNISHVNTELYIVEPDYENDICRATSQR